MSQRENQDTKQEPNKTIEELKAQVSKLKEDKNNLELQVAQLKYNKQLLQFQLNASKEATERQRTVARTNFHCAIAWRGVAKEALQNCKDLKHTFDTILNSLRRQKRRLRQQVLDLEASLSGENEVTDDEQA